MGLPVLPLQVGNYAFKGSHKAAAAVPSLIPYLDFFASGSIKDQIQMFLVQIFYGSVDGKAVMLGQGLIIHLGDCAVKGFVPAGSLNGSFCQGQIPVINKLFRIDLHHGSQTGTCFTGTVGGIKGKHSGIHFLYSYPAVGTGIVLIKENILSIYNVYNRQAVAQGQDGFQGIRQPLLNIVPDNKAIHYHLNGMLFVFLQADFL